jgi:hypothetical protein
MERRGSEGFPSKLPGSRTVLKPSYSKPLYDEQPYPKATPLPYATPSSFFLPTQLPFSTKHYKSVLCPPPFSKSTTTNKSFQPYKLFSKQIRKNQPLHDLKLQKLLKSKSRRIAQRRKKRYTKQNTIKKQYTTQTLNLF